MVELTERDNIRIVLVRTFHAGNIGSVARAMKTMGLSDLCLVAPRDFPSSEATKMAAGAGDVLDHARVFNTLPEAVADCKTVIASTARPRGYDLPALTPQQAATKCLGDSGSTPAAIIFGPERMGLHNDDIAYARYRLTIPANAEYNSLNLAAAVQIVCYEIFIATLASQPADGQRQRDLPSAEDMQRLFQHLEEVLAEIRFLRPHRGETMQRLRHLLARAEPDVLEHNILRGILAAIQRNLS